MKKNKKSYHHGNLAESLLEAVDEIATKFGLEAVSLRACAKLVGVSPSSAFRHYADKRALLTAFASRALDRLTDTLMRARERSCKEHEDPFVEVGLAYVEFALDQPALFRAMWREETIYSNDEDYLAATSALSACLQSGFADSIDDKDPDSLSAEELLAWSSVHGLAALLVDGPVLKGSSRDQKIETARTMIITMRPIYTANSTSDS